MLNSEDINYFGSGGGTDSIVFSDQTTASSLVVAISADFGSTGTVSSNTLTLGAGNTITFFAGASNSLNSNGVTFVTVTQASIDKLG